jgi:hypothetical protein
MTTTHRAVLALTTLAVACSALSAPAAPTIAGTSHYTQPDIELRGYDKVLIEEPTLVYDDASMHRGDTQRIRAASVATMRTAVGEQFQIVTEPGPGVIRLRAGITDVRAEKKPRRFWHYTPVGLIKGRIDAATGRSLALQTATIEIELTDSLTGTPLAAVVDADNDSSWRDVIGRLDWWIRHVIDDPQRWNADV